jgi:hypothetical protein
MPKIYLALYKGRKSIRHPRDLWPRLSDGLVRLLTRSPYSHCEIAVHEIQTACLPATAAARAMAACAPKLCRCRLINGI